MTVSTLFFIYSVYNILLGASFIFVPTVVMQGAGITPTPDLVVTQQIWGAGLVGIGVLAYKAKMVSDSNNFSALVLGFVLTCTLVVVVTIYHLVQGISGPPVYMNLAVNALIGIGLFMKSRS
jgi:hypothetical protein